MMQLTALANALMQCNMQQHRRTSVPGLQILSELPGSESPLPERSPLAILDGPSRAEVGGGTVATAVPQPQICTPPKHGAIAAGRPSIADALAEVKAALAEKSEKAKAKAKSKAHDKAKGKADDRAAAKGAAKGGMKRPAAAVTLPTVSVV